MACGTRPRPAERSMKQTLCTARSQTHHPGRRGFSHEASLISILLPLASFNHSLSCGSEGVWQNLEVYGQTSTRLATPESTFENSMPLFVQMERPPYS
eukprot:8142932-Alexandrium_andersonii.AAC.1